MGVMRILGPEGDTAVAWDEAEAASIDETTALFRQLLEVDGFVPFARDEGAPAAEARQIDAFDPAAEEIIWIRPITGG
ncbi:MAG: hypothetical protein U0U69_05820 [Acidimicrobiia bacterium]